MIRCLLLAILGRLKRVGRHLESKLKGEVPATASARKELSPVIGYDACLQDKKGRVLICYLTEPFHLAPDSPEMCQHQNMERSIEIACVFNRLGYVADVIYCFDNNFIPRHNYEILFGYGPCFDRMARIIKGLFVKVYFAPEQNPDSGREVEKKRRDAIKERRDVELALRYPAGINFPSKLVDAVILIHNSSVTSTYLPFNGPIYPVDNGGFDFLQSTVEDKDFGIARRNFMWMGSWLFVAKGLDLVLEVFSQLPELNLYVCGPIWNEPDFVEAYTRELFHTPNIHVWGRVDLASEEFKELTQICAYVVFPGSPKGLPGSVWAPMRCGVIPIVSREAGSGTKDFGFILSDCELDTIRATVLEAANKSPDDCQKVAQRVCQEANRFYTMEAWSKRFEAALQQILCQYGL